MSVYFVGGESGLHLWRQEAALPGGIGRLLPGQGIGVALVHAGHYLVHRHLLLEDSVSCSVRLLVALLSNDGPPASGELYGLSVAASGLSVGGEEGVRLSRLSDSLQVAP